MQKNNNKIVLTLLLTALGTTGCATIGQNTSGADTNAQNTSITTQEVLYDIKSGDSLALIAKRLTGQVDNWRAIAAHNDISNPSNIAAGDTLRIPTALLLSTQQLATQVPATRTANPTVNTGTGISVARLQPSLPEANANIKVSAVNVNRSFSLLPIGSPELRRSQQTHSVLNVPGPKVRVTGTYFPKGIYKQPADYAPLLQRVAPGSVFELEYKIGDWFKVKTDRGDGYIRDSDVTLTR